MYRADEAKIRNWEEGNTISKSVAYTELTEDQVDKGVNYVTELIIDLLGEKLEYVETLQEDGLVVTEMWKSKGIYYLLVINYNENTAEILELA